jgi:hypothetical protein
MLEAQDSIVVIALLWSWLLRHILLFGALALVSGLLWLVAQTHDRVSTSLYKLGLART